MPAAQLKTFESEGQILRCLVFVSSCMVCGHRWDDESYEEVNLQYELQARANVANRQRTSLDTYENIATYLT